MSFKNFRSVHPYEEYNSRKLYGQDDYEDSSEEEIEEEIEISNPKLILIYEENLILDFEK